MSTAISDLNCFENLIGLKGACDYTPPKSGYHLDDVGITETMLRDIITGDYKDSSDFFISKYNFAVNLVSARLNAKFSNRYKAMTLVEGRRIGQQKENLKLITPDAGYLIGQRWQIQNTDSFLDHFFSRIDLQINQTKDIELFFFDLNQNKLIDSITISAITNEVVAVYPHLIFSSPRKKLDILMCYDPDTASFIDGGYGSNSSSNCAGCTPSYSSSYVNVSTHKILTSDQKIPENLESLQGTAGLSSLYSVKCNHKDWVCANSNLLALPILCLTGFEVLDFALKQAGNERLNNVTWVNEEKTQKAATDLYAQFESELYNAMQFINLPSDSKCFVCKEPYKMVYG